MTATNQHDRPPVAGILPEPPHLNGDTAGPTAPTGRRSAPKQGRANPVSIVLGKLVSALRGDKYMVGAYPSDAHGDAAAPDDRGSRAREALSHAQPTFPPPVPVM